MEQQTPRPGAASGPAATQMRARGRLSFRVNTKSEVALVERLSATPWRLVVNLDRVLDFYPGQFVELAIAYDDA